MKELWQQIGIFSILFISIWQLDVLYGKINPQVEELQKQEVQGLTTENLEGENLLASLASEEDFYGEDTELEPDKIYIEKINLLLPVVAVPLVDGTWEVSEDVANYALGTSLISEKGGNVGIYGHAKNNIFANIKELTIGDTIILYDNDRKAVYEVTESKTVTPDTVEVFFPTSDPTLTLVTCDGSSDEMRYIVTAKLILKE